MAVGTTGATSVKAKLKGTLVLFRAFDAMRQAEKKNAPKGLRRVASGRVTMGQLAASGAGDAPGASAAGADGSVAGFSAAGFPVVAFADFAPLRARVFL